MKYWNDFITREDLETEPGVVDMEKVRILSLNTYLLYIGDFIDLGGNEYPDIAWEQVENFMVHDFLWHTHALEGRSPEPHEITEYLRRPENVETRQYLTYICVHANKENWPAFVKRIREEWNIPEEITVRNEGRINQMMEKAAKEWTWKIIEP